jgi:hypothetical protein
MSDDADVGCIGCGCFLALIGLAVAVCAVAWAFQGFPAFWK